MLDVWYKVIKNQSKESCSWFTYLELVTFTLYRVSQKTRNNHVLFSCCTPGLAWSTIFISVHWPSRAGQCTKMLIDFNPSTQVQRSAFFGIPCMYFYQMHCIKIKHENRDYRSVQLSLAKLFYIFKYSKVNMM